MTFTRLSPLMFGARGIAPIGYAAFAFALGVTAGVLIRRTLAAMAITLVVFAAVQFIMPTVVRPHLIAPVHVTAAFNANDAMQVMTTSAHGSSVSTMTLMGNFTRPAPGSCRTRPSLRLARCSPGRPRQHAPGAAPLSNATTGWTACICASR